ncbi:hypothetical protein IFR05_013012, partial [Cadophora sp. M221]
MIFFIFTILVVYTFTAVLAIPHTLQSRATCSSPVTVTGNPFTSFNLWGNPHYAAEVAEAAKRIPDATLAKKAAKFGGVGIFNWVTTTTDVPGMDALIKAVPCDSIIGFVVYNVPGRDCGSGASGGELPPGSMAAYKSQFIDPIRKVILTNPKTAIVLIIEPDSLPNLVTHQDMASCKVAAQGYKDGIAYALAQLNLPNVAMYVDAGNSGWLGWVDNLTPGAKLLADAWKAAGSPKQVRGFATNVANWNAWSQLPGEFSGDADAEWNPAQDEKRFVNLFGAALAANGMPNHAIMDTSRNGVTGLRIKQGDWCNVKGAGFGVLPTANTGDALTDAFVWVKLGGESDGGSDASKPGFDPTCALPDAFTPSPPPGQWNQAYFEGLVINAVQVPNVPDGDLPGSTPNPGTTRPVIFFEGTDDPKCGTSYNCKDCTDAGNPTKKQTVRWAAAEADRFLSEKNLWYKDKLADPNSDLGELRNLYDQSMIWTWGGKGAPENWECGVMRISACGTGSYTCLDCKTRGGIAAMCLVMTSWSILQDFYMNMYKAVSETEIAMAAEVSRFVKVFAPSVEQQTYGEIMSSVFSDFGLVLGVAGSGVWTKMIKNPDTLGMIGTAAEKAEAANENMKALVDYASQYADKYDTAFKQDFDKQNDLTLRVNMLANYFQNYIRNYTSMLFDGQETSMEKLRKLLHNGAFLTDPIGESLQNEMSFRTSIKDAFYAKLIPQAWREDPTSYPVILYQEGITTGAPNPDHAQLPSTISTLDKFQAETARVEYGTTHTLWLVSLIPCQKGFGVFQWFDCEGEIFGTLAGIELLNGTVWGSVTKTSMSRSSFGGWQTNGNKNGYTMQPWKTDTAGDTLPYPNGLETEGYFNIPVCSIRVA